MCNAVLPLPDGVNLIADYTFYWENNAQGQILDAPQGAMNARAHLPVGLP